MPATTMPLAEELERLARPIIGVENRTPLEVFDIMCSRIRHSALRQEGTTAPGDAQMHMAVSTFLAAYNGGNGLEAMRKAFEAAGGAAAA